MISSGVTPNSDSDSNQLEGSKNDRKNDEEKERKTGVMDRPIRKVKKTTLSTPSPTEQRSTEVEVIVPPTPHAHHAPTNRLVRDGLVEDPQVPGRRLSPDEYSHLASVRAKSEQGRLNDLTGEEMVAAWRSFYFKRFEFEDVGLSTVTTRKRAAQRFVSAARKWQLSRETAYRYIREMLQWWRARQQAKCDFPPGLPSFLKAFEEKQGEASHYFGRWKAETMKHELERIRRGKIGGES
jgi:hypothetical protein